LARYELTLGAGEKVLVEHPAESTDEVLAAIAGKDFLQFGEIKVGTTAVVDIIVASKHIALVRPLGEGKGSQFRPKR
jgi:hypothetical protein